jgi:hypothetical protein
MKALVAGAVRIGLDGEPTGTVTAVHEAFARRELAKRETTRHHSWRSSSVPHCVAGDRAHQGSVARVDVDERRTNLQRKEPRLNCSDRTVRRFRGYTPGPLSLEEAPTTDRRVVAGAGEVLPGRSEMGMWPGKPPATSVRTLGQDGAPTTPQAIHSLVHNPRGRGRIGAPGLWPTRTLRRLSLRGRCRSNLSWTRRSRWPSRICQTRRRMQINIRLRRCAVDARRARGNYTGGVRCAWTGRKGGSTCCRRCRRCARWRGSGRGGWRSGRLRQRFTNAYAYHQ